MYEKKKSVVKVFLLGSILVLTASCSKENEVETTPSPRNNSVELKTFLTSVDSLNQQVLFEQKLIGKGTRGNWHKWAHKWARRGLSAVADGCVATIAGAATGGFGGAIFGVLASGLYDDYMDYVEKKMRKSKHSQTRDSIATSTLRTFIPNTIYPCFLDSIGYYHNVILQDLTKSNSSYVSKEGNIDYDGMYKAVATLFAKYKQNYSIEKFNMQKNSIFSFTDNLIKELANSEKPDLLPCFNLLHSNEYLSLNFSNEDIEMLS